MARTKKRKVRPLPTKRGALLQRWRRSMKSIRERATEVWANRDIYREWRDTVVANPALDKRNCFFTFINDIYVAYLCTALRAFDDANRDSHSLAVLITEVSEAHAALTRDWFVGRSRGGFSAFADSQFTEQWGKGPTLDRRRVESDLRKLRRACKKVRKFVNKFVAHNSRRKQITLPTYGEVDAVLDTVYDLVSRYHVLIFNSQWGPPVNLHWNDVFDVKWRHSSKAPSPDRLG